MLDAECLSAADGFLEVASEDCLEGIKDLGEDFGTDVSGTFLLGPLLVVAPGDALDDTVGLAGLVLGFESVLGLVGFLVVESLEPSFSSSFFGEEGFLLVTTEPSLGEAIHAHKKRIIMINVVQY